MKTEQVWYTNENGGEFDSTADSGRPYVNSRTQYKHSAFVLVED